MKIRRYVGQDLNEAMLKVKLDLGDNAVVVSTGTIRESGFWGWFKKPAIEVLAIVDDKLKIDDETETEEKKFYTAEDVEESAEFEEYKGTQAGVMLQIQKDAINANIEKEAQENKEREDNIAKLNAHLENMNFDLKSELEEKDKKISELENKISNIETLFKNFTDNVNSKNELDAEEYKPYQLFTGSLIRNEVEPQVVKKIVEQMKDKVNKNTSVSEIANEMDGVIRDFLGKPICIDINDKKKGNVILFAGPTGVGKTTTIAKIASELTLKKGKAVGLITADTYRIGAVEQLKTYAGILNIPLKVIYSPKEVTDAIKDFSDKDVILIDTAGRNHKDKGQLNNLKELVEICRPDETYLLISANTGSKAVHEIINNYSFLPDYKVIFTKLDETSSYGIILNVKNITDKPLSYATIGQNVPNDIEALNVEKISKVLLGSNIE